MQSSYFHNWDNLLVSPSVSFRVQGHYSSKFWPSTNSKDSVTSETLSKECTWNIVLSVITPIFSLEVTSTPLLIEQRNNWASRRSIAQQSGKVLEMGTLKDLWQRKGDFGQMAQSNAKYDAILKQSMQNIECINPLINL